MTGLTEGEAYALCSMAVSFRVTQYSHQTGSAYSSIPPKAVHGLVPKSDFPADLRRQVEGWLRPSHEATVRCSPLSTDSTSRRLSPGRTRRQRGEMPTPTCPCFTEEAVLDGSMGSHVGKRRYENPSVRFGRRRDQAASTPL